MVNKSKHPLCNSALRVNKEIPGYQNNVNISPNEKKYK